ncbi:MAG: bifunctional transaldolase/phosoglucose isomerase [Chloroflexi bacterium]|nr:bifunctional transaldolase/phosoglucose isomerase [Chloroflexota bacterium]MCL5276025.1 bifunctional transaldolase/phosoglucose isomerase [Chloroflexota bacterium]
MSESNGNPNIEVRKYGQSFWYDNIQRGIIKSGELQKLIDEYGVLGVTSNPTIFEKAIANSSDYDEQLAELAAQNLDTKDIYERLAIADIQAAADILEPVYEQTEGVDGYISLEVAPDLAHDYEATVAEARRLHKAVARKNLMIKVPATPEGIPAIQTLVQDGININVTMIFSLDGYEAVARAYIAALKARAARGLSVDVASVASFFISRVDVLVDRLLDEKIAAVADWDKELKETLTALKGKAGIANGKLAYEIFKRISSEPEWQELVAAGARPQRVLWASTSTKNPAYPDTYYVDALIGQATVDTVPPATLKAFRDHGKATATLDQDYEAAHRHMEELGQAGISMPQVWQKLQDDGVSLFADAFKALLGSIDAKRAVWAAQGTSSGVDIARGYIEELVKLNAASRVWNRDASLWTNAPEHIKGITNRLGWLSVIEFMQKRLGEIAQFCEEVKASGLTDAVVLGMGGSSLAPDLFRLVFGAQPNGLRLHVLDTTDPTTVRAVESGLDLARTLFIVSSKSGGTVEVNSFYKYFRAKIDVFAADAAGQNFIAITDEGTAMQSMAEAEGFRRIFTNPSDIGGRYSALSYFGLLPAALAGIDISRLLQRAAQMASWCKSDGLFNPGIWLGAHLGGSTLAGQDKVTFLISPAVAPFGDWVEQLVAESTGKQDRGIVPIEGELDGYKGAVSRLTSDRIYVHLNVGEDTTYDRLVATLKRARLPVIEIHLNDIYDIGAEFVRWEFATAIAGVVLGVDPFDEPNLAESKANTKRLLDEHETHGAFSTEQSSKSANAQINKFLRGARSGDYVSVQAYLPMVDSVAAELVKLRAAIGSRTNLPVTLGYGPRFLHSTGQLHKGGANNVVAVQLTYDVDEDVPIPGEPYTFGTLIRAQALGDHEALLAHGRRVIRLHLGRDYSAGIKKVTQTLKGTSRKSRGGAGRRSAKTTAAGRKSAIRGADPSSGAGDKPRRGRPKSRP